LTEELRVLFVEDSEEDTQLLLRELARGGFAPIHRRVATEEELRHALDEERWDLVLCDWILPGFSAQAAIELLESRRFAGTIIVVSGSMGEEHVVGAMRAGANDYVLKHNLHRLVPAIRRELQEARIRRAVHVAQDRLHRQALIFENMHDVVVIADRDGTIVDVNPAAERSTGYAKAELVGSRAEFLGGFDDPDAFRAEVDRALAESGRWQGELPLRRADGSEGYVDLEVVPLHDSEGNLLGSLGVARDVTARRRAEEDLRDTVEKLRETDRLRQQLLSRLVAAQEEERQRIAAEIHDDPIQQLYAAGLRLSMLRDRLSGGPELEAAETVQSILSGTIDRLRQMLFELHPVSLESQGLGNALGEYIQFANRESATKYLLEDHLEVPLSSEIRSIAYRGVLECVSNVRKYADAKEARITIADHEGGVLVTVDDDGRGFLMNDKMDRFRPGHLGLPAMRERLELAGGRLHIRSAPGEGTTVEFWLPRS
jgi:PAS domain S-box-containing protein